MGDKILHLSKYCTVRFGFIKRCEFSF